MNPVTGLLLDAANLLALPVDIVATRVNRRLAGGVVTRHDLGDGREVLVTRPPGPGRFPVLVFVHGGAWVLGSVEEVEAVVLAQVDRGWAVVSVDHRSGVVAPWPAALEDVRAAVRWIRREADELGLDARLVVASGVSSGGHVVAMLAATQTARPGDAAAHVHGVVDLYGPTGLHGRAPDVPLAVGWRLVDRLLERRRGGAVAERSPAAGDGSVGDADPTVPTSPLDAVGRGVVPFLLVHGTADRLAPIAAARDFAARLRAVGGDVRLVEVRGAVHADLRLSTGAARAAVDAFLDARRAERDRPDDASA